MHQSSYQYYLHSLNKKPGFSAFEKIALAVFGTFLIVIGLASSLIYWQYYQEKPLRAQVAYLDAVSSNYKSTTQSIDELLDSFRVAGIKTQLTENAKEATPQATAAYYSSLDDISRILDKLNLTGQNITNQKKQLEKTLKPAIFIDLHKQIDAYYQKATDLLANIEKEEKFAKDMLLALGPGFYQTTLSDESLWQTGKNKEIIAYYENLKKETDASLAGLTQITPPPDFKGYHTDQMAYFELLVKTADGIINVLKVPDKNGKDQVTQVEKAYQILTLARKDNEKLSLKLLNGRLKLFDTKRNLDRFAALRLAKNSIDGKLTFAYTNQPQPKSLKLPGFLGGLQIL